MAELAAGGDAEQMEDVRKVKEAVRLNRRE